MLQSLMANKHLDYGLANFFVCEPVLMQEKVECALIFTGKKVSTFGQLLVNGEMVYLFVLET